MIPGDRVEYWFGDKFLKKGQIIGWGMDASFLIKWDDDSEGEYYESDGLRFEGQIVSAPHDMMQHESENPIW